MGININAKSIKNFKRTRNLIEISILSLGTVINIMQLIFGENSVKFVNKFSFSDLAMHNAELAKVITSVSIFCCILLIIDPVIVSW